MHSFGRSSDRLSVQLNIAEGYAYNSPRQFRRYLTSAYASAVETSELLTLLSELDVIPNTEAASNLGLCAESQALILGPLRRTRGARVSHFSLWSASTTRSMSPTLL
jgi:four helix bundle protein